MRRLFLFLLLSTSPLLARTWTSADGKRTFEADYISHDQESLTLQRENKEDEETFPLRLFSIQDLQWLEAQRLKSRLPKAQHEAFFDTLAFGDTREQVTAKLEASKLVTCDTPEILRSRTGLNGIYHTVGRVGELKASLFFDWDGPSQTLSKFRIQTELVSSRLYDSQLEPAWSGMVRLLTDLYGKPASTHPFPSLNRVPTDAVVGTHLWHTKGDHSVVLGPGRQGDKVLLVVNIKPGRMAPPKRRQ